jgi:hypothetical protein
MAQGAPGRKSLRSIRLKAENTPGTPVSPRFQWVGNGETIEDQREVTEREMQVGIFGGTDDTYIPKLMAGIELAETEATFEQLPDILMMAGLGTSGGGNRAGSAQGASGSTAVFTLPVPVSVSPITYAYTVEAGDSAGAGTEGYAQVMEYALVDEVTLSFAGGEAMKISATLGGRQGTATNALGTFSAVGTIPTTEVILSGAGSFWLSPAGSGWGTGAVTAGNILAGELTIKTTWARKFPIDSGRLHFHTAVFTDIEISGELTLEHQVSGTYGAAGSAGQIEKWRNQQTQLITMRWPGGAITEGTTYLNKELTIQLPIRWQKFGPLDDQDGNNITVGEFISKYNIASPAAGRGTFIIARAGTSEMAGA